ncbi:MAG: polyprenyl synthetase family protein [Lentimicrobium sp.]|jgi:geranylgeranyl diphosphate synthase type II|nr:polyprenyl synthetase family protein [Lentimicrobium sp.]MDD2527270.1 polyprenyl synthetase family protein [Lentimicrobiaceae bacterium]MDD4596550.1 polyprenyl synthetase family protein [Lentimicrobiaceae bacterium]MDY0024845.1 polyprenyl synthetase family protein [Lentimicrobium sp.]
MTSIEIFQDKINHALSELPVLGEPAGLYQPIVYALDQGGKRVRPLLTLIANEMFGGKAEKVMPAAIAIEIFHNFTLLHDDVIDQAPLRRGKETIYQKWDLNTAILSGDTMFAIAYGRLSQCEPRLLPKLMEVFTTTAVEVCEGQQYDIDFERSNSITIPAYLNMIRLKTAVLLAASLKIGALSADASADDCEKIYVCGENLGMAFQLQDDLLDAFGETELFGKQTGGDIVANKKTYLYLKTFEQANEADKIQLNNWYSITPGDNSAKVEAVLDLFKKYNAKENTEALIMQYYHKALELIGDISVNDDRKFPLLELAKKILLRKY